MRKVTIDRFDGVYAICKDADGRFFAIETRELPKDAKVGARLSIDDVEGTISVEEPPRGKGRK